MCACCMLLDELLVWCRVHVCTPSCVSQPWNTFGMVTGFVSVKRSVCAGQAWRSTSGAQALGGAASPACVRKGTFPMAPMYHGLSAG